MGLGLTFLDFTGTFGTFKPLDQWSANHGSVPTTRFIVSLIRTFDFLPIIDSVGGKDFTTPLWIASKQGHYEVLKLLHQAGANINAKDVYGNTPLHMASKYGHHKVSVFYCDFCFKFSGDELFGDGWL